MRNLFHEWYLVLASQILHLSLQTFANKRFSTEIVDWNTANDKFLYFWIDRLSFNSGDHLHAAKLVCDDSDIFHWTSITIDWFCVIACLSLHWLTITWLSNYRYCIWIQLFVIGHQCHLQVNIMCVYGFLVNVSLLFVI